MAVTDQISALRALGTDPMRKLVLPRVLAGLVMVPVLTTISIGIGMVGAWLVATGQLRHRLERLLELGVRPASTSPTSGWG